MTTLAFESKAHWSYSDNQLEAWRYGLTVLPEMITNQYVYVAEINHHLAGFFVLNPISKKGDKSDQWSLDLLFVSPSHMNRGIGRDLLLTASRIALQHGAKAIHIDSDPNAKAFYLAFGAIHIDSIAAPIEENAARVRPQLLLRLS